MSVVVLAGVRSTGSLLSIMPSEDSLSGLGRPMARMISTDAFVGCL